MMNANEAKNTLVQALVETRRAGIMDLINEMDAAGFWEAPAAGAHHMACDGGLAIHTANVLTYANKLYSTLGVNVPYESVVIAAVLHDLGKAGQYGKPFYVENMLKSGKRSDSKPFEQNKDLLNVPHEIRSLQIASEHIDLTEEEAFAILAHNGLYGPLKYEISGRETQLYMIIHWADMWASRVIERGEE